MKILCNKKSLFLLISLLLISLDILLYIAIEFFDYLNQFKNDTLILIRKIVEVKIKILLLVHFKYLFFSSFIDNNKKIKIKNNKIPFFRLFDIWLFSYIFFDVI